MKSLWQTQKSRAFTLVEMLVVIAIIAVLAALLLPALTRGKQRAQRIQCIGNLKEMGTAFQLFAHDHRGKFPMQIPQAEGGSEEYVEAGNNIPGPFYFSYRHLQTLANELVVPRILVCPADREREPAPSFGTLQNSNVSYFVAAYADYNEPSSVLAGDRNITNNTATASLVRAGAAGLRWTSELHFFKGNVLFADTHVEQINNSHVEMAAGSVYFLPTVKPIDPGSGANPPPSTDPGPVANPPPSTGSDPVVNPPQPTGSGPSAPGGPGGPSPGGSTPGTATGPNQQSNLSRNGGSTNAGLMAPQQQMSRLPGSGMAGSQMATRQGFNRTTFGEVNARETNGNAAVSAAKPAAAPAAIDDDVAPSLRMLGAARAYVATTSWWLWLLLALLIAIATYLFSRKKQRRQTRR